ncbi:MAG: hypothetical protein ACKVPY_04200 [Paracoccaceae bacterium]
MGEKLLDVCLFGACVVRHSGAAFEITGAKHKALFALLVTAPMGRRTRTWLQDMLWGTSCFDSGRQSLRRALSDIKQAMGPHFERILTVSNAEIAINQSLVHFVGRPGGGEFLEGIDIREEEFEDWLRSVRQNPAQIFALYSPAAQPPPPAILPSIVVLPFRMVMTPPELHPLGDWLAEEISRSLSRSSLIEVIAILSSREIRRSAIDVLDLRTRLKVDYCVVGSCRARGDRIVVAAECLDTATGRILWSREVVASLSELLEVASPAVAEIVRSVGRSIASEAMRHVHGRRLTDLADHQLLVAGVGMMHDQRLTAFARSRELIEEAARRAPNAPEPSAWLAEWYVMSVFNNWSTDVAADIGRALDHSSRALDLDPDNAFALTVDGVVHNNLTLRLDLAGDRFEAALDRNPNEAMAWLCRGFLSAYRDGGVRAVEMVEKARRLSPLDPFGYFYDCFAASAYLSLGDYATALTLADQSLAQNRRHPSTIRARICALHNLGRVQEARAAAAGLLTVQPGFTLDGYRRSHPAAGFKLGRDVIAALAASGIG